MIDQTSESGENEGQTLQLVLRDATARLASAGMATPRLDAEVLLRHVLGIDRARLFLRLPELATPNARESLNRLLTLRLAGQPVAYLTGTREFMGLPFHVSPDVLIPRPETEILVEWALDWLHERRGATVVDVGTGSGAIALSIAARAPVGSDLSIIATDVSDIALQTARRNMSMIDPDLRDRVSFVQGSLLETVQIPGDIILANLPYLTPERIAENAELAAEPEVALNGGADGLGLVRGLISDLPRILKADGAVGLELDPSQTVPVETMIESVLPDKLIRTIHDLAGFPRHVIAT